MATRIYIAEDHALVADGLEALIRSNGEFEFIGRASNGKALVETLRRNTCIADILLLDLDMPYMNGLEAARIIRTLHCDIKIIFLTMHDETVYLNKVIAVRAQGFVMKHAPQSELINALRIVRDGGQYFQNNSKGRVDSLAQIGESQVQLTGREIQVLKRIALGLSNSQISKELGISIRTVDSHRTNIKRKLKVSGIAGIVRYAFHNNLLL